MNLPIRAHVAVTTLVLGGSLAKPAAAQAAPPAASEATAYLAAAIDTMRAHSLSRDFVDWIAGTRVAGEEGSEDIAAYVTGPPPACSASAPEASPPRTGGSA